MTGAHSGGHNVLVARKRRKLQEIQRRDPAHLAAQLKAILRTSLQVFASSENLERACCEAENLVDAYAPKSVDEQLIVERIIVARAAANFFLVRSRESIVDPASASNFASTYRDLASEQLRWQRTLTACQNGDFYQKLSKKRVQRPAKGKPGRVAVSPNNSALGTGVGSIALRRAISTPKA